MENLKLLKFRFLLQILTYQVVKLNNVTFKVYAESFESCYIIIILKRNKIIKL